MKKSVQNISSNFGTILSTSFMLFLFGLMMTALFLANSLSQHVQENINVSVELKQDLTDSEAKKLSAELRAMPAVKSLLYISKEQAIEDLTEKLSLSKAPMETLGYNPLFPSMEINLHADFANIETIEHFAQQLKTHKDVVDVQYQPTVVEAVNKNIASIMLALFLLCGLFVFIVVVLIANTVRLNIYSHRFLFYTMKLVGADKSYILRPILRRQMINGVIAACFAIFGLLQLQLYLNKTMGGVAVGIMLSVAILTLVAGVIITLLSAYFSAHRYLMRRNIDLYHN